jgi:hypothetical protein
MRALIAHRLMPRIPTSSIRVPRGLLIVAASFAIALFCAFASISKVSVLPPKLEHRDFGTAGATTHLMVDGDRSQLTDRRALWDYFNRLRVRADELAHLMATAPAVDYIGRRAHIPGDQIAAVAPITVAVAGPLTEPGSEQRAHEILLAKKRYRLEIQSRQGSPNIDIYAQAPSTEEAIRLANASIPGMRDYLRALDVSRGAGSPSPLRLVQLGPARGGPLGHGVGKKLAAFTFLLAFALAFGALTLVSRRLGHRRASEATDLPPRGDTVATGSGAVVAAVAPRNLVRLPGPAVVPGPGGAVALRPATIAVRTRRFTSDGNWPRTTRVLPWMLAGFLAVLWLVPFDSIQLAVSTPIDLKLDRMLLPFIVLTWGFMLVIGGRAAPVLRATWIHFAVGAFVVIACLSVIFDAGALTQSLELDTSLKKLPLLMSYLSLFVMMASVIRREEVAPFLKYTLLLAVLCGIGMIWEARLFHNPFFEWSSKLLPGIFDVSGSSESGWDSVGRRVVHGPTAHPLVAAGMLSLAIPIAMTGILHAQRLRGRLLYGLAACVLMAAMLATQRKTGLLGPVAGIFTLAYFRRRELLRLAPAALVLLIAVVIVSPGTVAPVIDQFKPDRLSGADTVSDRASDYDAVRPDIWSHVALGRGYGSYQPVGHRILDSEVLVRTVETGVLGLVAFLALGISVVASARRAINSRHPARAPAALAGASAGVVFLVLATLFDTMSFPQVPYIFLSLAALVAALVRPGD